MKLPTAQLKQLFLRRKLLFFAGFAAILIVGAAAVMALYPHAQQYADAAKTSKTGQTKSATSSNPKDETTASGAAANSNSGQTTSPQTNNKATSPGAAKTNQAKKSLPDFTMSGPTSFRIGEFTPITLRTVDGSKAIYGYNIPSGCSLFPDNTAALSQPSAASTISIGNSPKTPLGTCTITFTENDPLWVMPSIVKKFTLTVLPQRTVDVAVDDTQFDPISQTFYTTFTVDPLTGLSPSPYTEHTV